MYRLVVRECEIVETKGANLGSRFEIAREEYCLTAIDKQVLRKLRVADSEKGFEYSKYLTPQIFRRGFREYRV